MKNRNVVVSVIVLILVVFIICGIFLRPEEKPVQKHVASVIVVPDDYPLIQSALSAAKSGDTVSVRAGVYNESLHLKDGVALIGESAEKVIIQNDASLKQHVILADRRTGLIKNITVRQTGSDDSEARASGIFIVNSSVEVSNCIVKEVAGSGIIVKDTGNPIIQDCTIEDNGFAGIQVLGSMVSPVIKNNVIRNNKLPGISFKSGSGGIVQGNRCENNKTGILIMDSGTDVTVRENTFSLNEEYGIYVCVGAKALVEENTCEENKKTGILVYMPKTEAVLKRNTCQSNESNGIYVCDGANAHVEENICQENKKSGILILNPQTEVTLKSNTCRLNVNDGISVCLGAKAVVEDNVCEENVRMGILVQNAETVATITGSRCNMNQHGILISESSDILVEDNSCGYNRGNGICVDPNSTGISVNHNVCQNNSTNGIHFGSHTSGIISGNTCIKNDGQGISAIYFTSVEVMDNKCNENGLNGIVIRDISEGKVFNNNCEKNVYCGISVLFHSKIVAKGNTCQENQSCGIYFGQGGTGTVEGNVFKKNGWNGIKVSDHFSYMPTLKDNECSENQAGNIFIYEGKFGRVRDMLIDGDFAQLETIAARLRSLENQAIDRAPQLELYYHALSDYWIRRNYYSKEDQVVEICQQWMKQFPESVTPYIVLVNVYQESGWASRGTEWGYKVKEEQWVGFFYKLDKAYEILQKAEESLEINDPYFYGLYLTAGMGLGFSDEEMERIFTKGISIDPACPYLYLTRIGSLLPKWGGQWDDEEKLARRAVELTKEKYGDMFYLYIATSVAVSGPVEGHEEFLKYGFSYERIKRGYAEFVSIRPQSISFRDSFCLVASLYGDKETARNMFAKIGKDVDTKAWCGRENYDKYHKWAYSQDETGH